MVMDAKAEAAVFKQRTEEMRKEIRARESEVLQRDKIITELRLRLPATEERDRIIDKVTATTTTAIPHASNYESDQAHRVAQSTVHSLQQRIVQKDETLKKYEELLRQARDDMSEMNRRHEMELRQLQDKLHHNTDAAFDRFRKAAEDVINQRSSVVPTNAQIKQIHELQEVVAEQDNSLAALRDKLELARKETQLWRTKYEEYIKLQAHKTDKLTEKHGLELQDMQNQHDQLQNEFSEKEEELKIVYEELETQKEANARAPTTTMKSMIERLKNQVALKEKQQQALSKALLELRADMVTQAQEDVKANAEANALEKNIQKVVDKKTHELQDTVEEKDAQLQKLKKDVKKYKDEKNTLNGELEDIHVDLVKKENRIKKLKEDKTRLESETESLQKKIDRMSTMQKQKGVQEGVQNELDELRRKYKLLQDQLKRSKYQAEKPYDEMAMKDESQLPLAPSDAISRWEEGKKWQKMVDRLKCRIREKDQELEKLHKTHEMTKNVLERANRDRESLEQKLKVAAKQPHPPSAPPPGRGPPANQHSLEDMRKKIYSLEEENARLRRELTLGQNAAFKEVQLRNKFLSEKLEGLEQMMNKKQLQQSQGGTIDPEVLKQISAKEEKLQKQIVELSEENIELKFEVEQANRDIPRLKSRIDDLQKYVEVIKKEKDHSVSGASSLLSPSSSNIRRIGESGRSARELEKTVSLLKKVVERTQRENEELKKAPGVISNEQFNLLKDENEDLRAQLEELRLKMGSALTERYTSQQKGTAKVMSEHDRLRKELIKERENNEKLRVMLKKTDAKNEMIARDFQESKSKLEIETAKNQSGVQDQKGWKSAVVTRMYEGKLKVLEEDLEKKNKMLNDVKVLLRESAEREQSLLHEQAELKRKVEVLERFPPGTELHDSDVVREFQVARLQIDRLECEKSELMHELQSLRKGGKGLEDVTDEEFRHKLKMHDKLMTENIDLKTQIKAEQLHKDKLQEEVAKLRKELSNFEPDFFEEIEDLKCNYREAIMKNIQYEEQLTQLSRQFGVQVNLPGL